MKKTSKSLKLRRETIRQLEDVGAVAGGVTKRPTTIPPSYVDACPSRLQGCSNGPTCTVTGTGW